jgi:peptidoglycan/LPS O-acetylase OafA/YrhL
VRADNFDLLRLLASLMVLWSHQHALLAMPEASMPVFNSNLGLIIFFAISGYLNTGSLLRNPSWWRFLVRRAFRIFPGLLGAAVFCVALGAVLTTSDALPFWSVVPRFVLKNTTILFGIDYKLPGLFEANPYPGAVNGSLWTLPIEVKFYIYFAILAVAVRYRPPLFLGAMLAILFAVLSWFQLASDDGYAAHPQQFAVVFVTGCVLALLERARGMLVAAAALILVASVTWIAGGAAALLPGTALAVILLGKLGSPAWLRPPLDISYGVYLYAFPVQQVAAGIGWAFWPSLAISTCVTVALAIASAVWIEKPALRKSSLAATKVMEQVA